MNGELYQDFTLLVDGKNAFPVILDTIQKAKTSLEINMFIWRDDNIGNLLAKTVLEAADRGVKTTLSIDKYGSVLEHLEESRTSFFHKKLNASEKTKIWGLSVFYPEYRTKNKPRDCESELYQKILSHPNITVEKDVFKADHSKYYIIDGKTLILGGINVEDKECGQDEQGRVYQDYMVKIEGEDHVLNFKTKRKSGEDLSKDYFFGMNLNNQENRFEMEGHYLSMIENAEREIMVIMSYFSPIKKFMESLVSASNRGVRVRILMPKNANFQKDTNYKTAETLLKKSHGKIEVYFTEKMVHAKMILTDQWCSFGSANVTAKAFEQLSELNLFVKNEPCAFVDDLMQSVEEKFLNAEQVQSLKQIKYNRLKTLIEGLLV